jgi:phosphate-selective porin OprO and OprP
MWNSHLHRLAALAAVFLGGGFVPALAQSLTAEVQALREQIQRLEQQLRALERSIELKAEPAATLNQPALVLNERGLSIASADRAFTIRLGGLLHLDHRYYLDSNSPNGFLFRRVRPNVQGTYHERFGFRVTPEFAGNSFQLLDATLSYTHSSALVITAGKFKAPFDLERLRSGANLTFIERAYPTILGPNREIGLQLSGAVIDKRLDYAFSVGNGVADNANSVTNPAEDLEFSGRLFARPFANDQDSALAGLGLGFAVTYGSKDARYAPANYASNGQRNIFSWAGGTVNDGTHFRWSPQLTYYTGPFGLLASHVVSRQEVANGVNTGTFSNRGWLVQGSHILTGETASYGTVTPAKPFQFGSGNWGAFEVAARVSQLDLAGDIFANGFANPAASVSEATSYGLGLNWYLNRNVKTVLNYEHTRFDGGAAGGADRPSESVVFSRLQFAF